jgi:hypothetical protein
MNSMVPEVHQGVHILHGDQVNTAAIATITTIRTTHWNIFLAPKANGTITTITRLYTNFRLVNKSHNLHAVTLKNQSIKTKKAPPLRTELF